MCEELVKRLRNRRICIQQSGSLYDFPLLGEATEGGMSMGLYLPNMEMLPQKGQMLVIFPDGTSYVCFNGMRERLAQTTAVPVPPHGDLIDRREAIIDANERAYDFWLSDDEVNATIQFLEEQPTIIPAEPAEEGE